ncbi:hypothetical protein Ocin01_07644 [Orchesella cincta]|uniref:EB domain-containing protein n=1 Tax=Orchesella cincta TaxID=48709 RepID=A0A1D2N2B3_ORCCI|nr:hypothetical protein Ocin01_07644 [Orchesella cincta]
MTSTFSIIVVISLIALVNADTIKKRIVNVDIGGHCSLGAAPVGPGGSWQVVEKDVEKVCAKGTSCRKGACNCDDLPDGTVTGLSSDAQGNRVCRNVAGQKCSSNNDCFEDVQCLQGVCTCDKTKKDFYCVDAKNDVYILA